MKEYIVPVPDQFENELFKGDPELIRCKDCENCLDRKFRAYCMISFNYVTDNDFCSWAVRKEDDNS